MPPGATRSSAASAASPAGLAPVIAPNGTLVMYSAALSSVVGDNGGDRSLFVRELLKEIRVPDLMAEETLNRTRVGVTRASRSEQVPWISSSLAEDFSFIPGGAGLAAAAAATAGDDPARRRRRPAGRDLPPSHRHRRRPPPVQQTRLPRRRPHRRCSRSWLRRRHRSRPSDADKQLALADDPTIKSLTTSSTTIRTTRQRFTGADRSMPARAPTTLAIKDFNNSLRLNPKDVEAFNNRCWARTMIGDLQAALKDCNEALRLRPNFVDALDSRGLVNLKIGQTKNAIADFDAALRINPRLTSSLYGRGLASKRNGSISEGDLDIANAKAMDPNIAKEFADTGSSDVISKAGRASNLRTGANRITSNQRRDRCSPAAIWYLDWNRAGSAGGTGNVKVSAMENI